MAKDWETLAAEYEGSNILIAEADCTIEDDDLCDDNGVEGFPTLKYGDPNALEDYDGGRDLPTLQSFAKASLKPSCSPTNLDLCDAEQKAEIEKVSALSKDELIAKIKDVKDTLKKLDDEQEKIVEGLQNQYEKISEETDKAKKAAKKDSNFKLMKSVLASNHQILVTRSFKLWWNVKVSLY